MNKDVEIEVALARGRMYQLLAYAFLYPDQELYALFKGGGFVQEARGCLSSILSVSPGNGQELKVNLDSLEAGFKDDLSLASLADLQSKFTGIFGHTISKEYPPYETQYGYQQIFQQTEALADISGFYRAFGLEVSDEVKERFDHISLELEFMYFLTYKEAYARSHHGTEEVEICREAQVSFLKEHLGCWVSLFARLLVKKAGGTIYGRLGALTGSFLAQELNSLGIKPQELKEEDITFLENEPEEVCFSCAEEEK